MDDFRKDDAGFLFKIYMNQFLNFKKKKSYGLSFFSVLFILTN